MVYDILSFSHWILSNFFSLHIMVFINIQKPFTECKTIFSHFYFQTFKTVVSIKNKKPELITLLLSDSLVWISSGQYHEFWWGSLKDYFFCVTAKSHFDEVHKGIISSGRHQNHEFWCGSQKIISSGQQQNHKFDQVHQRIISSGRQQNHEFWRDSEKEYFLWSTAQ